MNEPSPGERKVSLPSSFAGSVAVGRFISQIVDLNQTPTARRFVFDFGQLNWIEGDAITSLSNLIEWLRRRQIEVRFVNTDIRRAGLKYLDDSGFFRVYGGVALSAFSGQLRPTTIPLKLVEHADSWAWVNYHVIPWLAGKLNLSEASFAELAGCMYEIFNNIRDHSSENIGCAFVQWFPQQRAIAVTISDFGIGIPNSMRALQPDLSDALAIERSLQEGVTSKRHGRNLGVGLTTLRQAVVDRNGGTLTISSHFGRLTSERRGDQTIVRTLSTKYFYPGTLIQATLRTDSIEAVSSEREELEW